MAESKQKPQAKAAAGTTAARKTAKGSKSSAKAGAIAKPVTGNAVPKSGGDQSNAANDWRATTLAEVRRLIQAADPEIVEERKWVKPTNPAGVPVWSRAGIVCTGETYKQVIKLTFFRGASLKDSAGLFNSSLEGNARRAIDIREGEVLDVKAFKALVQAAVAENLRVSAPRATPVARPDSKTRSITKKTTSIADEKKKPAVAKPNDATTATPKPAAKKAKSVKLLAGGNPQIAKAEGDVPVQAYIAAIPGWKQDIAKRLDELITRHVPKVQKAVKWNSPFYGVEGQGWFASFHVFTRFIKFTFFKGTSLKPAPAGGTSQETRWIDIYQDDLDEAQLTKWIKQAAAIPGWLA